MKQKLNGKPSFKSRNSPKRFAQALKSILWAVYHTTTDTLTHHKTVHAWRSLRPIFPWKRCQTTVGKCAIYRYTCKVRLEKGSIVINNVYCSSASPINDEHTKERCAAIPSRYHHVHAVANLCAEKIQRPEISRETTAIQVKLTLPISHFLVFKTFSI